MEIRQLEALVGIDDHGTFSGAAESLGTVQSNISSRIARLEAELGTELVDRSSGSLTESGEVVVGRARRILNELGAIAADVSELRADVRGLVTLGMMGSGGRWIVPLLAGVARERFPHISLHIVEGSNSTLEPRLIAGTLDLAVLAGPVDAPELTSTVLFEEDLVLIVPREHVLAAAHSPVSLATLAQFELLLPLVGTPMRREIDDACRAQGVELRPLLEMDGMRTIASLTFDGMGISILPATMLSRHLRDKFVAVPLLGVARRQVVLVGRRFGFPAAPVRAIQSLLGEVVRTSDDVPDGVYVTSPASAIISR